MNERETLDRARMYIEKLANGIDPLTDREVPEDTLLNNVRLTRCFFYVAGVLEKILDNKAVLSTSQKNGNRPFSISIEQLENVPISQVPISITKIAENITSAADQTDMKRCPHAKYTSWLVKKGFLTQVEIRGKLHKRTNPHSAAIGIFEEKRQGKNGEYTVVLYNADAQRFLVDNTPEILSDEA